MPIEIRELVIKAVVSRASEQTGSDSKKKTGDPSDDAGRLGEIVHQVLEQLSENKNER
ncbi:MAG: DUF5908 family protein [Balneolales bacterium]